MVTEVICLVGLSRVITVSLVVVMCIPSVYEYMPTLYQIYVFLITG